MARDGPRDRYDCPRAWEADVVRSDGGTVHLRPVVPGDTDGLVALHGRLSERTRHLRYFGAYPRIPPRDLARFSTVDHHDRVAFVALLGDDIVAVARYERLGDGPSAEVAFVVDDAHQGRGPRLHPARAPRRGGVGVPPRTARSWRTRGACSGRHRPGRTVGRDGCGRSALRTEGSLGAAVPR